MTTSRYTAQALVSGSWVTLATSATLSAMWIAAEDYRDAQDVSTRVFDSFLNRNRALFVRSLTG